MPTTKQRINISISDEVRRAIAELAKRDRVPEATKAARLVEIALETEEDMAWDRIAKARDKKGTKFLPHKSAWK